MENLGNIDFLSVGVAIAANLILGFIVFIRQPRNTTYILFLLQTVILSLWSVVNYLSYQVTDLAWSLMLVRLVMFFAVPNSVVFLILMHTFPSPTLRMKKGTFWFLVVLASTTMVVTLTPLLFSGIQPVAGGAPEPIVGPGIVLFILAAVATVPLGIYFLIRRYWGAGGAPRLRFGYLLTGVVLMFSLILILNFILPAFFQTSRFIPLSAVFTLPFVAFTAYAIMRYHLLDIKVITTEVVAFLLAIVTLIEAVL